MTENDKTLHRVLRCSTCTWSSTVHCQWLWRYSVKRTTHHYSGRLGNSLPATVHSISMLSIMDLFRHQLLQTVCRLHRGKQAQFFSSAFSVFSFVRVYLVQRTTSCHVPMLYQYCIMCISV